VTELSCVQCQDRAAELAVGALEGRERAETLAHLQRCAGCQTSVAALATTVTRLVDLLPERDPPDGFADRVLAALPGPVHPTQPAMSPSLRSLSDSGIPRQRVPLAAAVLAVALLTGAGVYTANPHPHSPSRPVSAPAVQPVAALMTAPLISDQHQIGTAYISPQNPPLIFVAMSEDDPATGPGAKADADSLVICDLVRQDGSTITLGSFPLHNGHAVWATHTTVDPHTLAGATLTTQYGRTLGTAHFTPPTAKPTNTSPTDHSHDKDKDKDKDTHDKDSHHKDKNSHDKDSHHKDKDRDDGHGG
jgi:hypothetical protein